MDLAVRHWCIPRKQQDKWISRKGDRKQMEHTNKIPNLDNVKIDDTTLKDGCVWSANSTLLKAIGWNAKQGAHWDKFCNSTQDGRAKLVDPCITLLDKMDIRMI